MPHRTKKKFIDKKSAVTFHLVHRSQRDPLAANDEAPQRVLVPVGIDGVECDIIEETSQQREERISVQRKYGIGFDDDYDYMQHLREPDRQTAVLLPKDPRLEREEFRDKVISDEPDTMDIAEKGRRSIKLPSVALASKEEEDIGMLHRAIPPVGPQVDWDPDVVAAMDEDFDFDNPQNALDDDFILCATADENLWGVDDSKYSGSSENHQLTDDESVHDDGPNNAFFDQFLEEETRSRFTQYSMSSSVLPRSDQLTLLDDQFEKFYETYDEDRIGDLTQYEIDGVVPVHNISQEKALRLLLGIKDESDEPVKIVKPNECQPDQHARKDPSTEFSDGHLERDDVSETVAAFVERSKEKWDCESIISTYSNIYNHPTLIKDVPNNLIKLSKKTGLPLDTLPTRGLTAKQLHTLDLQNCAEPGRVRTTSEMSNVTIECANVRQRGETKEEKTARKRIVKEIRRERRAEKKATKVAFKQERSRQNRELLNVHHNLKGIKIS